MRLGGREGKVGPMREAGIHPLRLRRPVVRWRHELLERGVIELPLGGATGIAAVSLQDFHPNPADRFIIATAQAVGAILVTADQRILSWTGALERHDARL